jgi:hypothetical protein
VRVDAIGLLLFYLAVALLVLVAASTSQAATAFPGPLHIGLLVFAIADIVAIGLVAGSKSGKVGPFAIFMIAAPGVALAGALVIGG